VNGGSVESMSVADVLQVLYQCAGETLTLDVWRPATPLSSATSSPLPDSGISRDARDPPPPRRWDSTSESSKGSMKNIKNSGSQTDSLDSPGVTRRRKDKKSSDKDLNEKPRHSVHILDKAIKTVDTFFRQRNKSTERMDSEKTNLTLSRPQTMIDDHEDLADFTFPTHRRGDSNFSNNSRSSGRNQKSDAPEVLDPEMTGTGTWPKMRNITTVTSGNGTVIQPQKNHHKRPTIDSVICHSEDQGIGIPTARVPPLPPQRGNSSFTAVRHTPQNSDSTITSHPPSPSLSPQPSNASSSPYFTKSPVNSRHPFQHEILDQTSPLGHGYHTTPTTHFHTAQRPKVITKSPPRAMPHIQSQVATNQYDLRPNSSGTPGRRRPTSVPVHDRGGHSGAPSPSVFYPPTSNHPGPYLVHSPQEPSKPLQFVDHPPLARPYPTHSSNNTRYYWSYFDYLLLTYCNFSLLVNRKKK